MHLLPHTGGRTRAVMALTLALAALLAITASAAAEPPTDNRPATGPLTPVTLRVATAPSDGPVAEPGTVAATPAPDAYIESGAAPIPTLGPRPQREARMGVTVKPTPTPRPHVAASSGGGGGGGGGGGRIGGSAIRGLASWYCRAGVSICHYQYPDTRGFDAYAAAGPRLREAIGNWRGRIVSVNGVRVKLVDWCQCYKGERHEKVIDLYYDVFRRVGGTVTIRW
jgi:hypothetical protein